MDPVDSLASRLPEGRVSRHPGELAHRARDWWALPMLREARGELPARPRAVVFPGTTEEVAAVLGWAQETGTPIVPRGGGSGVAGGALAFRGSVVLDLSRMDAVLGIDETSHAVEVQAGIRGDRLDAALEARGLTLGHSPQSLSISTVGGWIAARSAGQTSAGYGAIENLLLGLVAVLAGGAVLRLRPTPRSAAGVDLRQLFAGSEGTLGVVTEATLSIAPRPAALEWRAFGPRSFHDGLALARELVHADTAPLLIRVYDEPDAVLTFGPAGQGGGAAVVGWDRGSPGVDARIALAETLAREGRATELPAGLGDHWWSHRFDAVDLYRSVMGKDRAFGDGVIVDTMEVAGLWRSLPALYDAVHAVLDRAAEAVGCHLSHSYPSGASLYFTFLIRAGDDRAAEDAYLRAWADAIHACHREEGTMTHHHGVGLLKAPFMADEIGATGVDALRSIKDALDPAELLNPGKVLPGTGGPDA